MATVDVATVWANMFDQHNGAVNEALKLVGVVENQSRELLAFCQDEHNLSGNFSEYKRFVEKIEYAKQGLLTRDFLLFARIESLIAGAGLAHAVQARAKLAHRQSGAPAAARPRPRARHGPAGGAQSRGSRNP